ncbi:transcription elongation factor SPT6 homolog isoform X2 [Manihot esculenta]|uniref:transcription elongation factor SPT6 homolog isoform X2 n=1 Tax=Manihot esculenta TaxID=3983 RepID=UPI001CC50534|nr:transcription elongation factor SPT6 homolog isoform X2 [Manihot esculenta]
MILDDEGFELLRENRISGLGHTDNVVSSFSSFRSFVQYLFFLWTRTSEGRIIKVIVRRVLPQQAFCALDFGLTGLIMKDDYLDGNDDFSLTEKLHEGDLVTCKIKPLEKSRYQVLLTCKESELKSCRYQTLHDIDPYYCEGKNRFLRKQDEACKNELAKKHFKQKTVNHPRFKNITADEAMESLSDMEIGENIFHPSPRGVYYLVLSLKVYNGVYVHKDIIEGQKDHRDIASLLHIGKKLKIGADLDEVSALISAILKVVKLDLLLNFLAKYNSKLFSFNFQDWKTIGFVIDQYVNPLVTHVKAIINFKKFKRGSKAEVDELLRAEKSEHPMKIVYCFGISYEHPGTFKFHLVLHKDKPPS